MIIIFLETSNFFNGSYKFLVFLKLAQGTSCTVLRTDTSRIRHRKIQKFPHKPKNFNVSVKKQFIIAKLLGSQLLGITMVFFLVL